VAAAAANSSVARNGAAKSTSAARKALGWNLGACCTRPLALTMHDCLQLLLIMLVFIPFFLGALRFLSDIIRWGYDGERFVCTLDGLEFADEPWLPNE